MQGMADSGLFGDLSATRIEGRKARPARRKLETVARFLRRGPCKSCALFGPARDCACTFACPAQPNFLSRCQFCRRLMREHDFSTAGRLPHHRRPLSVGCRPTCPPPFFFSFCTAANNFSPLKSRCSRRHRLRGAR